MPRIKQSDLVEVTVFKPSLVKVIDINTCLAGERNKGGSLTEGVLHIYSYLIKKSLGEHEGEFGTQWIQIPKSILRSFLTQSYSNVIDLLVGGGLLEVRDWAPKEEKKRNWKAPVVLGDKTLPGECKAYRIPQQLYGTDRLYTHTKLAISKKDQNKIRGVNQKGTELADQWRQYIIDQMADIIIIDTPESRAALDQLYAEKRIRLRAQDYVTLFNQSHFYDPIVDPFGLRCHAPVVNAPKIIRPFQRFKSDPLSPMVEIDFVNSQPAILAAITAALIYKFAPECAAAAPLFEAMKDDAKWIEFQAACFSGQAYEALAAKYNELYALDIPYPISRDEAKDVFYLAAFCNYQYIERFDLQAETAAYINNTIMGTATAEQAEHVEKLRKYHCFKACFSSAHTLFSQLKQLDWKGVNPGKQYTNNCFLAQRCESGLIYTVCVKALVEAGITKVFTRHDSLVVREQDEPLARTIIQAELDKLTLPLLLKKK